MRKCCICILMLLLVAACNEDTVKEEYESKEVIDHHWDEPCYNESDRMHTIKWKSSFMYDMIRFDSEFVNVHMRGWISEYSMYVAIRLFGNRLVPNRTVIARLDQKMKNSYWEYSQDESNMLGSFMCVDYNENNMYLYYNKEKHHVLVLEPKEGNITRVKQLELNNEIKMINFNTIYEDGLLITALSSDQIILCIYKYSDDFVRCSFAKLPSLETNDLMSSNSIKMIQTVFDYGYDSDHNRILQPIIVSVNTSYNACNFTVLQFDNNLTLQASKQITFKEHTNSLSSIKLILAQNWFGSIGNWLIYVMSDNTNSISTLVIDPHGSSELQKFEIFPEKTSIITQINDIEHDSCYSPDNYLSCRFNLVYEYVNTSDSNVSNSTNSLNANLEQQSRSKLFHIRMETFGMLQDYHLNYSTFDYEDVIGERKFNKLAIKSNDLYLLGSIEDKSSTDSWYLKIAKLNWDYEPIYNPFISRKKHIINQFFDNQNIEYENISNIALQTIDYKGYKSFYYQDAFSSKFNVSIYPQEYALTPYFYNRSQYDVKIEKNKKFLSNSSEKFYKVDLMCDNESKNLPIMTHYYNCTNKTDFYYDNYSRQDLTSCNISGCAVQEDTIDRININVVIRVIYATKVYDESDHELNTIYKNLRAEFIGCNANGCIECHYSDANSCKTCNDDYIAENGKCKILYDENYLSEIMFRVVILFLIFFGIFTFFAFFKPYLWILVMLIIENMQMQLILLLFKSFNYDVIYDLYSYYLQYTPGFINLLDPTWNIRFYDFLSWEKQSCFFYNTFYSLKSDIDNHNDLACITQTLIFTFGVILILSIIMIMLIIFSCLCYKMRRTILKICGHLYFRIFNIMMLPTIIFSFQILQRIDKIIENQKFYLMAYIVYAFLLIPYILIQVVVVFYSCTWPTNSFYLVTTLIDNKVQMSARFYQAIATLKKFIFAFLLVYEGTISLRDFDKAIIYQPSLDQQTVLFYMLLIQVAWVTYITAFTPLKYRFANFTQWVNETALAVLICMEFLHRSSMLQRDKSYYTIEIILHFPLGAILVTLMFIVHIITTTDWKEFYVKIMPYRIRFERIKVYKHFGKFEDYGKKDGSKGKSKIFDTNLNKSKYNSRVKLKIN